MQLNEKTKKILGIILVVVAVLVFIGWSILNPAPEHIEDTNGPDNYNLQSITEADVVALKMGTRGGLTTSETHWDFGGLNISSGVEYSCKKFTGVLLLDSCTIFKGSDIHVLLPEYRVKGGNFAFYVVFDGQVIGKVEDDGFGNGGQQNHGNGTFRRAGQRRYGQFPGGGGIIADPFAAGCNGGRLEILQYLPGRSDNFHNPAADIVSSGNPAPPQPGSVSEQLANNFNNLNGIYLFAKQKDKCQ